jgi:hypothetical protein
MEHKYIDEILVFKVMGTNKKVLCKRLNHVSIVSKENLKAEVTFLINKLKELDGVVVKPKRKKKLE